MRIGNRIFPYPTLNSNATLSEYKDEANFSLRFDVNSDNELPKDEHGMILRNVHFELTDDILINFFMSGKLKCALIVECSATVYRKMFDLDVMPQDVVLQTLDLKGAVDVSAYLWATENIDSYRNTYFDDDYLGYSFDIEKYDILAVDDGFRFRIDVDPIEDNKMPSIFTIVQKNSNDQEMDYTYNQNGIVISLSPAYFKRYETIKNKADVNNIMFAIMAIPTLAGSLFDIRSKGEQYNEIDEIVENYSWFKAVCKRYLKVVGTELTMEDFLNIDSLKLAQIVMNHASCNGIKNFADFLIRGVERDDGEDE